MESFIDTDREQMFHNLMEEILRRRLQPENMYEIAAYLESEGWNDERAAAVFGAEDIFELAQSFWQAIQGRITAEVYVPPEKHNPFYYIFEAIRNFLRGLIFALPMAVSVMAMLFLGFSLWSYENLGINEATSIAIGTILSFMTIGGFTQAIARRGFFYLTQNYYNMGRRMTFLFVRIGYIVCAFVSAAILLLNFILEVFPSRMVILVVLFYFFLSSIWLAVTIMYILRKELVFTGLIAGGIAIVLILYWGMGMDIIVSQIIALTVVAVTGILLVLYYFKVAESKMEKGSVPELPRMSIVIYSVIPYFLYGFLYFTFLYTDRIVAWSVNDRNFMPYLIWFRGPYELGLDFGLLTLMLPMGFIEVAVNNMLMNLEGDQKNFLYKNVAQMHSLYVRKYLKNLMVISFLSVICAVSVYFLVRYVGDNYAEKLHSSFIQNPTTHFVFVVSLVAYSIIAAALFNAIILFSLSQPELVNQVLLKAFIVDISVGFLLSRWTSWLLSSKIIQLPWNVEGYAFAVFGVAAGAVLFLILTTQKVLKVLNKLDYCLYAAT